jgi:hypothetical protein
LFIVGRTYKYITVNIATFSLFSAFASVRVSGFKRNINSRKIKYPQNKSI